MMARAAGMGRPMGRRSHRTARILFGNSLAALGLSGRAAGAERSFTHRWKPPPHSSRPPGILRIALTHAIASRGSDG